MSIARKALMVETLPDGALPIYDKEFDTAAMTVGSTPGSSFVEAFVVGEEGGDIVRVTKPKRVTVPTFEIVSNPMIPITQIKERRFDLVARSLNLAKAEVGAQEDAYVFSLFDAVATAAATHAANDPVYNPDIAINAPIDINSMADGFGQVQRHDLSVAFVFFNPRDYTDLLKWTQQNIDRETQRKLLKTGVMGYLWGATLLQSRKVGYGSIYILADAEFLGVIPERIPLTVMSADRPGPSPDRLLDLREPWLLGLQPIRRAALDRQRSLRCIRKHGRELISPDSVEKELQEGWLTPAFLLLAEFREIP